MSQTPTRAPLALALLAATCLTPVNHARAAPGAEFQVNTYTVGEQRSPATASSADGKFVIVWGGSSPADQNDVSARLYDAEGRPQGSEFRVNTTGQGAQGSPSVAMDADGDFVVVWSGSGPGDDGGVFAQRFDSAGFPLGPEFRVNTTTEGSQSSPAVAMDADGDFVVAWDSRGQDDPADAFGVGVFAQRFDSTATPLGGEFQVNSTTTNRQTGSVVAMDADGGFVVTWSGYGAGDDSGVFAQRFDAAGASQGGEFRVNSTTELNQWSPSVAMDADGDFVVAWQHCTEPGPYTYATCKIAGQRFDALGTFQGPEFQVNTLPEWSQWTPSVAMDSDGDFVVAWTDYNALGNDDILGRHYDAAGVPKGEPFQVSSIARGDQNSPSVAMDAGGHLVIAWSSSNNLSRDILARRFLVDRAVPGDFDGDSTADILWRDAVSGSNVLWQMDGLERLAEGSIPDALPTWEIAGVGDMTGDTKADVLWRDQSSGNTILWQMDGFTREASGSIGLVPTDWHVEGLGDFDGDSKADILWRNAGTGHSIVWLMNGFVRQDAASIGSVAGHWAVAGLADFNGDGKSDILWRNVTSGTAVLWQMDGFTKQSTGSIGTPSLDWQVAGLGDFTGDAMADILWRNLDSGGVLLWQMDGAVRVFVDGLGAPPLVWQIEQVRDYSGDGLYDILWRNASTENTVVWLMDGSFRLSSASLGVVDSARQPH